MKGDQRRRTYQRIRGGRHSSRRFHHQTIAVNLPHCPAARTPPPRVNLVYFWEPLSLEAESSRTLRARCPASAPAILDTSRLLIATAAFIELPPNGGQRQVQSQERPALLFLTRVDVVVRAAADLLARGALLRDLTSTRWQRNGTSHPQVAALAARSRRVRDGPNMHTRIAMQETNCHHTAKRG